MSAAVFLLVVAVGIVYCIFWPKVFSATATVVVQPQKVPGSIVAPTITSRIEDRLQIITQQVLSRSRLAELIDRFDLYKDERVKQAPDEVAEKMRGNITIKITRKNYFTISYIYRSAKDVAQVTNALASFYVDSNLRIREQDAVGTSLFLKRELERMRENLEEWEAKLTKFRQDHPNELPEAQAKNLMMINTYRTEFNNLRNRISGERGSISWEESRIAGLTAQIKRLELDRRWRHARRVAPSGGTTDSESEPDAIRQEIERLKVFYKDTHPDLQRMKRHLAKAELNKKLKAERERKEAEEKARTQGMESEAEVDVPGEDEDIELQLGELRELRRRAAVRVKEAKERILAYQAEQQKMKELIAEYQGYIDNGPVIAERLEILMRGYEVLHKEFNQTHAKWLEADMAANLERTQRGEQFEVVDPAQVPDRPFRPDVKKALPMAIAVALALAVALSFGLNFIDTSFSSVSAVERFTEFPVLVVVPPLVTKAEVAKKRARLALLGLIYGVIFLILLGFIYMLMTGAGIYYIDRLKSFFS
jgi:succinoglycan biosynthesis transport protein ExoP